MIQEKFEQISGVTICYGINGHGPHYVLCLPGMLGTWRTDFSPQLSNFDPESFTMIAWDPPGYGKSRPYDRKTWLEMYKDDAEKAHELMKKLNLLPYSVLGWSDGAISALFLASKYQDSLSKMVIWGGNAYNSIEIKSWILKTRDVRNWHPKYRESLESWCSLEYAQDYMECYAEDFLRSYAQDTNVCREILAEIRTPTLIIEAEHDLLSSEHPKYLQKTLPNARLIFCEKGRHHLHLQFPDWFREKVQNFLLQDFQSNL